MATQKKIMFSMFLALLFVTNVHGKARRFGYPKGTQASEQMKFGARVGVNMSSFVVNEAFEAVFSATSSFINPKPGLRCDLYGEYALTDTLGVHLTLMYTQKGTQFCVPSAYFSDENSYRRKAKQYYYWNYDYMALAPSLRMYPGQDRQFCIFLGSYVGYLVSAKIQKYENGEKSGDPVDSLDENIPEEERPNRFDFGAMAGIDYEFDSGVLLGGYCAGDVGLVNVIKENKDISNKSEQLKATNWVWQAWIGYNFAKLLN